MASLHLLADARSPRRAREFTRQVLGELRVDSASIDDAELIVTEVVTNAVIHAGTDMLLEISADADGSIRISVTDYEQGTTLAVRAADPEAPTGRGLQIVDTLADSWSVAGRPDGKVVEILLGRGYTPIENVG